MSGTRTRPPGSAVRLLVMGLVVAACGATVGRPGCPIRRRADRRRRPSRARARSSGPPTRRPPTHRAARPSRRTPSHAAVCRRAAPDQLDRRRRPSSSSCAGPTSPSCRASPHRPSPSMTPPGSTRTSMRRSRGVQPIVTAVNGTGPYRLEHWDAGSEISLARNEAYWGASARNERVIVRWRAAATDRLAELEDAKVDGIDDLDPPGATSAGDDIGLRTRVAARAQRVLPRLQDVLRAVRQRTGPARHRPGDRPGADRRAVLPARLGGRQPLRAVQHPARLRRQPVVRVRPGPGQGAARRGRLRRTASIRRSSSARRPGATCPTRPRSPTRSSASSSTTSASAPSWRSSPRTPSWPTPTPASWTASTCSARSPGPRTSATSSTRASGRAPRTSSARSSSTSARPSRRGTRRPTSRRARPPTSRPTT